MKRAIGALLVVCAVSFAWVSVDKALAQNCNAATMHDGFEYWFWFYNKTGGNYRKGKLAIHKGTGVDIAGGKLFKGSVMWVKGTGAGTREQGYTVLNPGPAMVVVHKAKDLRWESSPTHCEGSVLVGNVYNTKGGAKTFANWFKLDTSKKWGYRVK